MAIRVGINGLGRIGRAVLRQLLDDDRYEVSGLNDLDDAGDIAYLLRYDSVYGRDERFHGMEDGKLIAGSRSIPFFHEAQPERIPWGELGTDVVIESTGAFRAREAAAGHLRAGARKVIISADSKDADGVFVPGVNSDTYDPATQDVVSMASCTTNCLAPVLKVLDDSFGVEYGFFTTVHAYTSSQSMVDKATRHRRRGRAGALSIIPTTTGAAKAAVKVLPQLQGRVNGMAMRVPVPTGSVTDLTAGLRRDVTVEEVNEAFRRFSSQPELQRIFAVTDDEIVSQDIVKDVHSSTVDANSTAVLEGRVVKVIAWYDNEWGYAARLVDFARFVIERAQGLGEEEQAAA